MKATGPKVTASSYFIGLDCPRKHGGLRLSSSRACVQCNRDRANKHRTENPDKANERVRRFAAANPESVAKRVREWRAANPEKYAEQQRRGQAEGRGAARTSVRRNRQKRAMPPWVRPQDVEGFYTMAARVGKCLGIKHHVDHIYPIKGDGSSGLHVPWNLRVLPARLNIKKGNKMPSDHTNYAPIP